MAQAPASRWSLAWAMDFGMGFNSKRRPSLPLPLFFISLEPQAGAVQVKINCLIGKCCHRKGAFIKMEGHATRKDTSLPFMF